MNTLESKYEELIEDLRAEYRPQREWSQGSGLFLVFGHFLVGVGAGAWLIGLVYGVTEVLLFGYGLAALGGISHLLFLGHPERAWRMMRRVRSSWISRGFWGLTLFLAGGFLYLAALLSGWATDSPLAWLGYALALIGMAVLIVYMGFVYTASKAIPFWNSPLHPLLYMTYAARGGVAALMIVAAFGVPVPDAPVSPLILWAIITAAVIVLWLLDMAGIAQGGEAAARRSLHEMLAGRAALYFYGGTLLVGLIVPAVLATGAAASMPSAGVMAIIGLASVVGDFFIKFTTIRAGVYAPLWPGMG